MSARGYNKGVVVGHLTADPELRTTSPGTPFTLFRLASTGAAGNNGPTPAVTPYFRAILWDNATAAAPAHRAKGHRVRVDGRRENRKYPNPATQQEHRFTEIVWRDRVFLGGPIESGLGAPGSSLRGAEPPPDAAESI